MKVEAGPQFSCVSVLKEYSPFETENKYINSPNQIQKKNIQPSVTPEK